MCFLDAFQMNGGYAICAGLEQVIDYICNLKFEDDDIQYLNSLNNPCRWNLRKSHFVRVGFFLLKFLSKQTHITVTDCLWLDCAFCITFHNLPYRSHRLYSMRLHGRHPFLKASKFCFYWHYHQLHIMDNLKYP